MLAWQPVRALARIAARPPSASSWAPAALAARSLTRVFSPSLSNHATAPLGTCVDRRERLADAMDTMRLTRLVPPVAQPHLCRLDGRLSHAQADADQAEDA